MFWFMLLIVIVGACCFLTPDKEVPARAGTSSPTGKSKPPAKLNGRCCTRIKRNTVPYHKVRGWQLSGGTLHGYYRTSTQAFEGRIRDANTKNPSYFILDPPDDLLTGPHGACFRERKDGAYWVHFSEKPKNIDVGIQAIELCLKESESCGKRQSVDYESILARLETQRNVQQATWQTHSTQESIDEIVRNLSNMLKG